MKRISICVLAVLISVSAVAQPQPLVCPANSAASGRPCEVFHYHAQVFDPETRVFVLLTGTNQFASQAACDRARDAAAKRNTAVVEYARRIKEQQWWEADRIGPCHCDLTDFQTSTTYLTESLRAGQARQAEEVRRHTRARLLRLDLQPDSELITGLFAVPPASAMLSGPRLAPLPKPVATVTENKVADLKMPRITQGAPQTFELALAEPVSGAGAQPGPPAAPAAVVAAAPPVGTPAPAARPAEATEAKPPSEAAARAALEEKSVTLEPAPVLPPVAETTAAGTPEAKPAEPPAEAKPAPGEPSVSAEDAADAFISRETERIQKIIAAVADPPDETGQKVIDECMARGTALANLKSIILGSGMRSALAVAARNASSEADQIALIGRLFGSGVASHWVPKVTTDVLIEPDAQIDAAPEKVLHDSTGQYGAEQKRRAFYVLLARGPITEEQQLWLSPMVDRFLQ